jgi:hypothetical protein
MTAANARLLRQVVAWWIFGERPMVRAHTLKSNFFMVRPLFDLCSENGIVASDLVRFPLIADQIAARLMPSMAAGALDRLHELYACRDQLGFTLLDTEGLRRLEASLPEHENRQTPYIPPRIWLYQVTRLRAFLDDFIAHRERIEACFHYCMEVYATDSESDQRTCVSGSRSGHYPFTYRPNNTRFVGPFSDAAYRFGVADLLSRWCLAPGEALDASHRVSMFGNYFTQVVLVGTAYLLNHSGMRIHECQSLRADCLRIERDPRLGAIYLLRGETSKTTDDDDALWVTSPSAQVAVDAMSCVSRLRMEAAVANPNVPATEDDIKNPGLSLRAYEPWGIRKNEDLPMSVRNRPAGYESWHETSPNLFDPIELKITAADLNLARLITPSLDPERFAVGLEWPLAWHQLRRTLAVNMTASGLVSDTSLQVQLKHATRAMSLYYGQGYSKLNLNKKTRNEYVRTAYEMLSKQIGQLFTDRHVSPLGEKHKTNLLRMIDPTDQKALLASAKKGHISYRQTLLGGCLKKGSCPYGGIDNIVHCGGGLDNVPCAHAIFDRHKRSAIHELGRVIASRLVDVPVDSPCRESLQAQQRSVENVLNVLDCN